MTDLPDSRVSAKSLCPAEQICSTDASVRYTLPECSPALPIQAITLLFVHTVEVFLYICFHIAVGKVFWFLIGSCGIPMGKQRGCETEEQYQTGYSLKHHVPPWCCVLTADPTSAR